jgi:hypothetical protein
VKKVSRPLKFLQSRDARQISIVLNIRADAFRSPYPGTFTCRYVYLYEKITGKDFQPPDLSVPINKRMDSAVRTALGMGSI